jgi:hypothetical protein
VSIKIGREPSRARYHLRDPAVFRQFLRDAIAAAQPTVEAATA